jgi:hypothetical protein
MSSTKKHHSIQMGKIDPAQSLVMMVWEPYFASTNALVKNGQVTSLPGEKSLKLANNILQVDEPLQIHLGMWI